MARPKKQNIGIIDVDEMVEVKAPAEDTDPVMIETVAVTDKVPELEVKVVSPKPIEKDKTAMPTPICDIPELTDEDKQILIERKIKNIISQTQVPYIPALIKFKEPGTTSVPPMFALVDFDHRFVDEAWDYYKTNVRDPYVKDFLQLVVKAMNKPNKIFTRLVMFNYE